MPPVTITEVTPEEKYQQLFEEMYSLCDANNWGDPFSYARSREIHLAGILGHRVSDTLSGADAYDSDNNPVEYKSTIGKKLTATYNGISVQNSWEDQLTYLREDKIGKYKDHFFARYHLGKVVEIYKMSSEDVLSILIEPLKKQFFSKNVKKDPRLGYTISNKLIRQFGEKVL
tara:strand:+ start:232 stop:750 length:519 start_codon:yes stop_codon:yes gene_type:complete